MRVLLYLIFLFGFMSMFSCEKLENKMDKENYFLPSQKSVKINNRSNVGQYNFSVEVDTMNSASGILMLEWGNTKQKMSLKFTNPRNQLEYTSTKNKSLENGIILPKSTKQASFEFEVSQSEKGLKIHFNDELVHHQDNPLLHLAYFNYDTYNTYKVISFSLNQ